MADNSIKDNSPNNLDVIESGGVALSSFLNNRGQSGSVKFDNPNARLIIKNKTIFNNIENPTGDFTFETIFYWTGGGGINTIYNENRNSGLNIFLDYNGFVGISGNNSNDVSLFGPSPEKNVWNHLSITRKDKTIFAQLNGNDIGYPNSNNFNYEFGDIHIGGENQQNYYLGYMSDIQFTEYAKYKSKYEFTTPQFSFPTNSDINYDPNFNDVSILLNMSDNGEPDDSSVYNRELTKISTIRTYPGAFGDSAIECNISSSSHIQILQPNGIFDVGDGDYTFETWAICNGEIIISTATQRLPFFTKGNASIPNSKFRFMFDSQRFTRNQIVLTTTGTNALEIRWGLPIGGDRIQEWNHWALMRKNGITRAFVNGTQLTPLAGYFENSYYNIAPDSDIVKIGAGHFVGESVNTNPLGSIVLEDFRFTKGIARYDKSFIPPSRRHGTNIPVKISNDPDIEKTEICISPPNTVLRKINANYGVGQAEILPEILDYSKNNYKYISQQIKFGGLPDRLVPMFGNSDTIVKNNILLSIKDATNSGTATINFNEAEINLGLNDFTIEFFYYMPSTPIISNKKMLFTFEYNLGMAFDIQSFELFMVNMDNINNSHKIKLGTSPYENRSAYSNRWLHIAICRKNGLIQSFINGIPNSKKILDLRNYIFNKNLRIGRSIMGDGIDGNFVNFKIIKNIAKYTSTFQPPTRQMPVPDESVFNKFTSLLLNFNTSVADISPISNIFTITNGSSGQTASIVTDVKKFGAGSIYFNNPLGTGGSRITTPNNIGFAFGTGDFTIEFWSYKTTQPSFSRFMSNGQWALEFANKTSWSSGNQWTATAINQWVFVVLQRKSGQISVYYNNVLITTFSDTTNYSSTAGTFYLGADSINNGALPYNGYIDDLRITKGIAREIKIPTKEFTG